MSLITIDQLLESVDLDFEPRWVTKNLYDDIEIWSEKPDKTDDDWYEPYCASQDFGKLKLAEFSNKDWQDCIYEVPRKEEPKDKIKIGTLYIDKNVTFGDGDDDDVGVSLEDYEVPRKTTGKIEKLDEYAGNMQLSSASMTRNQFVANTIMKKINELVDVVNEINENYACIAALTDIRKRLDTLEKCVKNKRGEE